MGGPNQVFETWSSPSSLVIAQVISVSSVIRLTPKALLRTRTSLVMMPIAASSPKAAWAMKGMVMAARAAARAYRNRADFRARSIESPGQGTPARPDAPARKERNTVKNGFAATQLQQVATPAA